MKDKISVIVPVYNVEKFLDRCVTSIINQSYKNLEIILVDDGSTDSSKELCNKWGLKDKRIKVFHKKNGGLSDARNYGFEKSSGKYITFVDSDDYLPQNAIEVLYNSLSNTNSDISCGDFKLVYNADYEAKSETSSACKVYDSVEALKEMMYMHLSSNSACCKLYKSLLFDNIKYPYGKLYEDLGTTYKLFFNAKRIVDSKCIVYYYYQNKNGIMHYKYTSRRMEALHFALEELSFIEKNCPSIIMAAKYRVFIECLLILNDMPLFNKDKKIVKKYIKKFRKELLFDDNLFFKQKMMCFSSFFGHFVIKGVFRIKNKI